MLVHDILEFHAQTRPDAPALRDGTRTITYGELDVMAESIADALVASGVGPGDRYAVLAGNCLEFFALYFGAAKIGGEFCQDFGDCLVLLSAVNIFIGLVNWFPMLPFDGGHMVIALYERIRSRRGRRYRQ